jgi:nucleotide-binding universal stress UspA family protein
MLRFRKILHPHDFSRHATYAFHVACSLARDHRAKVVILHVSPLPSPALMPYGGGAVVQEELDHLKYQLDALQSPFADVEVERVVMTGYVAEGILRFAHREGCDLIVMGTHGRKGIGRLLMGSIAEQVSRQATCPVLTVKSPVAFEEFAETGAVEMVNT